MGRAILTTCLSFKLVAGNCQTKKLAIVTMDVVYARVKYLPLFIKLPVYKYRLHHEVEVSMLFTQPRAAGPRLCK